MRNRVRITSFLFVTATILAFAAATAAQIIYDNGPLSTGPTSRSGVAAPAGFTWSEVSHDFSSVTATNTLAGVGCQLIGVTTANRCADDFNVPVGQTWTVSQVIILAYQTGSSPDPNPFVGANLRIWRGRPGDPGSVIVFGDTTTNRMGTPTNTTMFRIFNSGPPSNTAPGTTRLIRQIPINVSPAAILTAGNYWIDFQLDAGSNGNFTPPTAITGIRGVPGWNARQQLTGQTTWQDVLDVGNPSAAEDIAQDFPFKLVGSVSGAPAVPASRSIDFDGDNKTDLAVARSESPSGQTTWWISNSGGQLSGGPWGLGVGFASGDRATPADYDGDGKTDIAVWRPGPALTASFFILNSGSNTVSIVPFGQTGDDVTVVDDFDGDGKADPACYRAGASGTFFYRGSLNNPSGAITYVPWGTTGDSALPGDYDGDGKADFAIFRSNAGQAEHWRLLSNGGTSVSLHGLTTDRFVTGDFDADGRTDLAAVRTNGANFDWYILWSSTGVISFFKFGNPSTDYLVPGDYDGDKKSDIAVWRSGSGTDAGRWFIINTSSSPVIPKWGSSSGALSAPDYPVANWNVK